MPREVLEQVSPEQRLLEEQLDLLSSSVPSLEGESHGKNVYGFQENTLF